MASTPSASALSAVLRYRRNIWTTPSARLSNSKSRELPVKTASLWETFTHGERIVLGRLAISCCGQWKKTKASNVCHRVSQPAHAQGHAREPRSVCARPSLCAPRAKVVFVYEAHRGRPKQSFSARGPDTAVLWVCARTLTSLVSDFVSGKLQLVLRTGPHQEAESTDHSEDPQTSRAAVDSPAGEGSVREMGVTEDRPD